MPRGLKGERRPAFGASQCGLKLHIGSCFALNIIQLGTGASKRMQLPGLCMLFGVQFPRGLEHRRFRVDADDAADIRRKAECEKPWSGAEINRACCFDNPSFCATVRKYRADNGVTLLFAVTS